MRNVIIFALAIFASGTATAACNNATLQGNYATAGAFNYYYEGIPSVAAGVVYFNGKGKITVRSLTEGSYGDRGTVTGNGTYSVNSQCVGTARLTLKQNGSVLGNANLNFGVGGTKASPEILGVYSNQPDGVTGSIRMIKSSL